MFTPSLLSAGLAFFLATPASIPSNQQQQVDRLETHDQLESRPRCRGQQADFVLINEKGDFIGTSEDDVIVVIGGSPTVWAQSGDDLVCVHSTHYHRTQVYGSNGNDIIVGYSGSHYFTGNAGNDVLIGNGGSYEIEGGDGSDHIIGSGAASLNADGGAGNDMVNGSSYTDWIDGGDGNDSIFGWSGDDYLDGDGGADKLVGGLGYDSHDGGDGEDICNDYDGPVDGGDFTNCESGTVTPGGPDALDS